LGPQLDNKTQKLVTALEAKATALGFDALNITAADSIPNAKERLNVFLEKNYHGSMGWMAETAERRAAPKALWSEVNSVIMLAMNYGPDDAPENHPLAHLSDKGTGGISVYARHRDYHDIIKGRLKELASILISRAGGDVKVFVDTAPVMEKPLGRSGRAWLAGQAHQSGFPQARILVFLGAIFTTLELPDRRRDRSLRLLQGVPRCLPDRCLSRRPTSWMRGAAFPISPSSTRSQSR
jgi:epoxyqueuosine reductase